MRALTIITLGLALLFVFAGCETEGEELNDDNYADFVINNYRNTLALAEKYGDSTSDEDWLAFMAEAEQKQNELLDEYGWTMSQLEAYIEELSQDEARLTALYEKVAAVDPDAALSILQ